MKRISTATKFADKFGAGKHGFRNGDAINGVAATDLEDAWFDHVQEEIASVIEAASIVLDAANRGQLLAALRAAGVFQTPPQFDDSTKASTTAFTRRAAGSMSGHFSGNATVALTAQHVGALYSFFGSTAGQTITLPAVSAVGANGFGSSVHIVNNAAVAVTISRAGADVLQAGSSQFNTISLQPGDSVDFTASNAGNAWIMSGGSALLPYAGILSQAVFTTPAQFDSSQKLATTAFADRIGLQASTIKGAVNGGTTLPATDCGKQLNLNGTAGVVTLPAASACKAGTTLQFFCSINGYSVSRAGTDVLYTGTTSLNSIALNQGDTLELMSDGGTGWLMVGGSAQLKYAPGFAGGGLSGYQKLPSGLIVQYGSIAGITDGNGILAQAWPIAFPNALLAAIVCNGDGSTQPPGVASVFNSSATAGNFRLIQSTTGGSVGGAPVRFNWVVLGY